MDSDRHNAFNCTEKSNILSDIYTNNNRAHANIMLHRAWFIIIVYNEEQAAYFKKKHSKTLFN